MVPQSDTPRERRAGRLVLALAVGAVLLVIGVIMSNGVKLANNSSTNTR